MITKNRKENNNKNNKFKKNLKTVIDDTLLILYSIENNYEENL